MKQELSGITLATSHMKQMVAFYTGFLGVEFNQKKLGNHILYESRWGKLMFNLCPASLAGITSNQNRHQLEIEVGDIYQTIILVKQLGGSIFEDIQKTEGFLQASIRDPDENSIVLIQIRN